MKRLSILLLSMLCTAATAFAFAYYDFKSGDLYYNITSDTTVEVTYQESGWWSETNYQGLTSATIPETVTYNGTTYSVTSIGDYTFYGCSSLTSITIPNSVTSIRGNAFGDCFSLTSMVVENENTVYDSRDNCNAIIKTATNTLIAGCQSTTIPNSVTSIGEYAFWLCSALTSITIPNSVASIGSGAFGGCSALTTSIVVESGNTVYDSRDNCNAIIETATNTLIVGCQSTTIPESVTSIGNYAFALCSALTSITIPESVTSIGFDVFDGCSALTQITCLAPTPPTCGDYCFYNVPRNIPLYVPAESVEAYKAANTWKEFDVQALTTDATLSSLTYDGMMVPFFDAGTLHYTVDLPSETVAIPVVDAVANDPDAQVLITQAATLPGEATVEVIAADGTMRQTYTIYFSKKSTPTAISDSPDPDGTASDKGAEKVLQNGQLLILRNGETYDMMGERL